MSMRASCGGAVGEVVCVLLGSRSWYCASPTLQTPRRANANTANLTKSRTPLFSSLPRSLRKCGDSADRPGISCNNEYMAISSPASAPGGAPMSRVLGRTRLGVLLALLALLILCAIFSWRSEKAMEHLQFLRGQGSSANGQS